MKLDDFHTHEPKEKLQNLAKSLINYGIDLTVYESLSNDELEMFLNDLESKRFEYVSESTFNSCYEDAEYTKLTLLTEALRIMLREITPKRKPKKLRPLVKESDNKKNPRWRKKWSKGQGKTYTAKDVGLVDPEFGPVPRSMKKKKKKVDETLDYKVHMPTNEMGHDDLITFGVDDERAYEAIVNRFSDYIDWRGDYMAVSEKIFGRIQEMLADMGFDRPIELEANNKTPEEIDQGYEEQGEKMDVYAQNQQPVGGTHENEQQAGIYVAIMDPNRFLNDDNGTKVMAIEPANKSANEMSPLSMKVAPKMIDALQGDPDSTEFEVAGNIKAAQAGNKPSKIIAVYKNGEEMTENESRLKGLGDLVENTLLAEGELERAEVVLASRDIVTKLQGMIQDIGKMGTEDIMPMIDGVRNNFGANMATKFSTQTEELIQSTADGIEDFKSSMEQWSSQFETRISDEDSQSPVSDMSDDMMMGDMDDESVIGAQIGGDDLDVGELGGDEEFGGDEDLAAELGGDDAAAGDDPLGRLKKEESRVVNLGGKKVKLTNEQLLALAKAKKIMERVRALGSLSEIPSIAVLNTVIIDVHGKKVRLNEEQIKALVFAKNWKRLVEAKKAKTVRLSESQAHKLMMAKKLTEKIRQLTEAKV